MIHDIVNCYRTCILAWSANMIHNMIPPFLCLCRSVIERMLGARLVMQKAVMGRALSFEYLNRQLVWHELSELMLFVLPLLRVTRLKRLLQTHLPALAAALTGSQPSGVMTSPDPDIIGVSPTWSTGVPLTKTRCCCIAVSTNGVTVRKSKFWAPGNFGRHAAIGYMGGTFSGWPAAKDCIHLSLQSTIELL